MATMKQYSERTLESYSAANIVTKQTMVTIERSKQYTSTPPDAANYTFVVSGTEIEGENEQGDDVQYPWEGEPTRHHKHVIDIKKFYLDKTP
ncbi:unnamed protein product, partial [Oppiella nova]